MKKSMTEIVFMMLILILFLFCSFFTILKSADFYQSMQTSQQKQDQVSIPYLYLLNKLNQPSQNATLSIQQIEGVDCLILEENLTSGTINTVIFYQDGMIYELLTRDREDIDLNKAEAMIRSYGLQMQVLKSNLQVSVYKQDGNFETLLVRQGGN